MAAITQGVALLRRSGALLATDGCRGLVLFTGIEPWACDPSARRTGAVSLYSHRVYPLRCYHSLAGGQPLDPAALSWGRYNTVMSVSKRRATLGKSVIFPLHASVGFLRAGSVQVGKCDRGRRLPSSAILAGHCQDAQGVASSRVVIAAIARQCIIGSGAVPKAGRCLTCRHQRHTLNCH